MLVWPRHRPLKGSMAKVASQGARSASQHRTDPNNGKMVVALSFGILVNSGILLVVGMLHTAELLTQ